MITSCRGLLLLLGGLLAASPGSAQTMEGAWDIYGKLALGLNYTRSADGETHWDTDNQASRLGFKGSLNLLDSGLAAIYQYEVGIDPWTSSKSLHSPRNSYAGIEGRFGRLIAGRLDTPFKQAQGRIDLFNDTRLDITRYLAGEVRHGGTVQYSTPTRPDGVLATIAWMPSDEVGQDDGLAVSLTFKRDRFGAAAAMMKNVAGDAGVTTAKANPLDAMRVVLDFAATDALRLGVLAQHAQGTGTDRSREIGWTASVGFTAGHWTLKGQLGEGRADRDASGVASNARQVQAALGTDYDLSKAVTAFAYLGLLRSRDGAAGTASGEARSDYDMGFGMSLKF